MTEKKHRINYQTAPKSNGCYTTKEIAFMLGISIGAARRLIRSNQFESFFFNREHRVRKSSFDEWLEKRNSEGVK